MNTGRDLVGSMPHQLITNGGKQRQAPLTVLGFLLCFPQVGISGISTMASRGVTDSASHAILSSFLFVLVKRVLPSSPPTAYAPRQRSITQSNYLSSANSKQSWQKGALRPHSNMVRFGRAIALHVFDFRKVRAVFSKSSIVDLNRRRMYYILRCTLQTFRSVGSLGNTCTYCYLNNSVLGSLGTGDQ